MLKFVWSEGALSWGREQHKWMVEDPSNPLKCHSLLKLLSGKEWTSISSQQTWVISLFFLQNAQVCVVRRCSFLELQPTQMDGGGHSQWTEMPQLVELAFSQWMSINLKPSDMDDLTFLNRFSSIVCLGKLKRLNWNKFLVFHLT